MDRIIRAWAPGSCGEWLQGWLDGRRVLVSCPIKQGTEVELSLEPGHGNILGLQDRPRSQQAVHQLLDKQPERAPFDLHFQLSSQLPMAKGMASSSADISACLAATLRALGQPVEPAKIAQLAASMEPSDSIMYPELALMDSLSGEHLEALPAPPPIALLSLDFGGRIDTLAQLRREQKPLGANHLLYDALALLRQGLHEGNPHAIAEASAISARANRLNHPKPALKAVERLAKSVGAYGISIAHSGPLINLLLAPDPEQLAYAKAEALKVFPKLAAMQVELPCGGGVTL